MRYVKLNPGRLTSRCDKVPIVQEAVWAPEDVTIFGRRNEIVARTDTRSPDLPGRNVVDMPNTLLRMEYINNN